MSVASAPAIAAAGPRRSRAGNERPSWILLGVIGALGVVAAVLTRIYTDLELVFIGHGLVFIAAGLVAWAHRPTNPIGKVMILFGFLWWVPTEAQPISPLVFTITNSFQSAASVVLAYLLLSYPQGRLTTKTARAIVIFAIFRALYNNVFFLPFYDPRAFGCVTCPAHMNLLLWKSIPRLVIDAGNANPFLFAIQEVSIATVLVVRFIRGTRPARMVLGLVLVPAAVLLLADTATSLFLIFALHYASIFTPSPSAFTIPANVIRGALFFLPLTFFAGVLRLRARRARVSRLVVDLGEGPTSKSVQQAVSETLGDPTAEIGFWVDRSQGYVTAEGRPMRLPAEGSERVATRLESDGRPLAVIVHDAAFLEDPGLVEGVGAAARLAVENERLQAEVRAQLEEVKASRARILAAGDSERRRIERNLHDGAQQRLVSLALALRMATERAGPKDAELAALLHEAGEDLSAALGELRELSRGLHPGVVAEEGLAAAIETLTERAAVPISVDVPEERFPEDVEVAAYFVVSEALANVAKHSGASKAAVRVSRDVDRVQVEVSDDGVGGADPRGGTGLRGLDDRVAAIDGSLDVESPPGRGTSVRALLPCG
ncbi:MAG: sensor histidine kinase [Actinomycetota bacterium]|nr:sensor histidine kinase [Actinomycetota bacterium]